MRVRTGVRVWEGRGGKRGNAHLRHEHGVQEYPVAGFGGTEVGAPDDNDVEQHGEASDPAGQGAALDRRRLGAAGHGAMLAGGRREEAGRDCPQPDSALGPLALCLVTAAQGGDSALVEYYGNAD